MEPVPRSDCPETIRELFAQISPTYDLMNSAMSLRLHRRWRNLAVSMLGLSPGDRVLDVCCGTGDFAIPLRKAVKESGQILGIDFCAPMLQIAYKKRVPMRLALADACRIPLRSESVDGVTVGWGLRNVADYESALREIYRVLKPGGKFVSLDMAVPRSRFSRSLRAAVFKTVIPVLAGVFGRRREYQYLPNST